MNRDPKAGCIIMIIGAVIFGGLIIYAVTTPFRQSDLMQDFMQREPAQIITSEQLPSPSSDLLPRLQAVSKSQGQITLTKDEINHCISKYDEFSELQGTFALREILADKVLIDISFALRPRPFSDEIPYLNGIMHAIPEIKNDEIILNVTEIESVTGEVPEGFLSHLQQYRIMQPYSEHEHLGRAMFACQSIELAAGSISLTFDREKYQDPKAIEPPKDESEKKKKRLMNTTLFSFLLVGGLFYFLVKRRNNQSAKAIQAQAEREH